MVFKVFEERAEQAKPEQEVYVRLRKYRMGAVCLCVCDKFGEEAIGGIICIIEEDGTLRFNDGLNNNLGLQLDKDGRIVIK